MSAPQEPRVSRRALLDSFLGFGFVSSAFAALYPITRFLAPPRGGEPSTTSVVAAKAAQVPANSGIVFPFGTKPAILVRTPEGEFRAFTAVCTHL